MEIARHKVDGAVPRSNFSLETLDFWDQVRRRLLRRYGEDAYCSWINKIVLVDESTTEIVLGVPGRFIREWVLVHYYDALSEYWQELNHKILNIEIRVLPEAQLQALTIEQASAPGLPSGSSVPSVSVAASPTPVAPTMDELFEPTILDPRYRFEHFVVGTPNALAHAAAFSVADAGKVQPGCNPLFLYGGVGLGKTHLMHAIAWHIADTTPQRRVLYISAEKFMYQFVRALKNKDIVQFKKQFRSVDVLMVDDVQFICGKDSTQEEFFHTFNALIENNCQLVISGDRSPSDLDGMEDRIKSRLGWGLVADVHATNYELRLGILESKMEILGVQIPRDVLEFLAQRITANVRELEGALHKIVAHMTLMSAPMTLSLAQHVLRDLLRTTDRSVSLEMIQKTVSDYFRIKLSELVAGGRHRAIARPRQMAMYLCKQWTSKSLSEIGDRFGGKDHTTVMHAIRKVEELMSDRGEFYDDMRRIEQRLQGVN